MIQYHPDRSLLHLGGKFVRCLAHDGSFYSEVGASGNPVRFILPLEANAMRWLSRPLMRLCM